ncbi:MAG: InlB B-repeat-containing protein, partial [Coriobacteriales bacterium]
MATNSTSLSGGTWYFTDKYNGFTVDSYRFNNGTWQPATSGSSVSIAGNLQVRYSRNSYTLSFYNYNTTSKEERVKYEDSLARFASDIPSRPEGLDAAYQFQGWYKDDALTQKFDFASETMPAAGLTLYAKWAAPDQTATTHLSMAVSGSDTVSFDIAYGSKIDPAQMPTVKDSNGNVVSQGDDSLGVVTMPANTEWAGWATREGDSFVMFNFDSEIYSALELYPYWISTDKYLVNYAANGGAGTVSDESSYDLSVQARVASGESLTAPVGKVFLGWSTSPDSTSAQYQPGDSITVSDLADASSRIVTLYAVWGGTPAITSLTYRTNYPAEAGLTDTSKESVVNVENNYGGGATGHTAGSLVTATPEELGFETPDGYYSTGWSDGTNMIAAGESIGIDNLSANVLTAQWCKKSELAITVTGAVDSKTYNGKEQSVSGYSVTYALDGSPVTALPDGLTLSVSGETASGTDVGTYETSMTGNVSISGSNAYKYKVTTSVSEGSLTIDKMAIENVGESASRTYTGSEIELTGISWATVAEGQSISGLTYSAKGTAAGTYDGAFSGEAKVVDASGVDVTANYEITNTPGALTIGRAAELTVHATGN